MGGHRRSAPDRSSSRASLERASPTTTSSSGRPSTPAARSAAARTRAVGVLGEPDDAAVVAEVVVAQLRDTGPGRARRRPSGGTTSRGSRSARRCRARPRAARACARVPGEQLVAVGAGQPRHRRAGRTPRRARRRCRSRRRPPPPARTGAAGRAPASSTAAAIRSGRLCSSGGRGCTSTGQPRRAATSATCRAIAPQATPRCGRRGAAGGLLIRPRKATMLQYEPARDTRLRRGRRGGRRTGR